MKNITLRVDEDVLDAVREHAARERTTLNALVREFLADIASRDNRVARARKRLAELSEQSQASRGDAAWSRDELHER